MSAPIITLVLFFVFNNPQTHEPFNVLQAYPGIVDDAGNKTPFTSTTQCEQVAQQFRDEAEKDGKDVREFGYTCTTIVPEDIGEGT